MLSTLSLRRWSLILWISFLQGVCADKIAVSATGAPPIRESALRAHIKFLADDLLQGRGTGAPGGEIAAHYIASQLQSMGLKGAGAEGSFFQPVSLVGVKADPQTTLTVSGNGKKETFQFGNDFVVFTGSQQAEVSVETELVFVGFGIESPGEHWNDYKGQPEDYRGKILVILVNDPPATSQEPHLFGGKALTYQGRWTYKYEEAARRGAAGALLLHTDESAGYPWSVVRSSNGSWRFDIAREEKDKTSFLPLRAWMTDSAAHKMMSLAGKNLEDLRKQAASRDFHPIVLGLKGKIELKSEVKHLEAPNVVGILEGSQWKNEYVVWSGHWDHLGMGEPDGKGDRIYNGAVDNASGVAAVLEIAFQLSRLPEKQRPKRSLLFLFPTAEEQGLLGAEWYVKHPLVPLAKTVADINLDALNVLGRTKDIVALGADRSTLYALAEKVAQSEKIRLGSDPHPEQGSFFRSDHFPFARVGVPAVSIDNGTDFPGKPAGWGEKQFEVFNEQHYHQPSDEYQANWDLAGMVQETRFALELGKAVADAKTPPQILKP
jgi:Zn-dependent M28 family amino/carboxypeptidase